MCRDCGPDGALTAFQTSQTGEGKARACRQAAPHTSHQTEHQAHRQHPHKHGAWGRPRANIILKAHMNEVLCSRLSMSLPCPTWTPCPQDSSCRGYQCSHLLNVTTLSLALKCQSHSSKTHRPPPTHNNLSWWQGEKMMSSACTWQHWAQRLWNSEGCITFEI
jgi:hypothetical protein